MVKYSSYHDNNKKDNYRSDRNLGTNTMHLFKKVNNSTNINKTKEILNVDNPQFYQYQHLANNHISSLNYWLSFDFTSTSVCYMFLKNLFTILSSIINKIKKDLEWPRKWLSSTQKTCSYLYTCIWLYR